jgi:hypothetical protein
VVVAAEGGVMADEFSDGPGCPDAETHGNPFRFCGLCGWIEPPCGAPQPSALWDATCTKHQDHSGPHSVTVEWE